ncbi:hypothetical protein ACIPSA_09140 [Streptomyces sp. NPDC086549]|uniref:hypothetical protein n=1 Tax=Streptomyces sp. NPDC086549 TaxID=3365752 RepID=UPI0037FBE64C
MTTDHARMLGRVPRPIACALAAAAVPLVLRLPTPSPTDPLLTPGGTGTPTAPVSTPAATAPTPSSGTPPPTGTTPRPAGPAPARSGNATTPAHAARPSASTARAAAKASPSAAAAPIGAAPLGDAPLDPPRTRPADTSWVLRADRLVLRAVSFRGVVRVRTAAGPVRALKFVARSVDAVNLDATAGRGRAAVRLRARSTATLKGQGDKGVVTLYIRKLSGKVTDLGGAPLPANRSVTITPDAVPPWLAHPAARTRTITCVGATVSPVAQFGGNLSVKRPLLRARAG